MSNDTVALEAYVVACCSARPDNEPDQLARLVYAVNGKRAIEEMHSYIADKAHVDYMPDENVYPFVRFYRWSSADQFAVKATEPHVSVDHEHYQAVDLLALMID